MSDLERENEQEELDVMSANERQACFTGILVGASAMVFLILAAHLIQTHWLGS